VGYFLQKVRAIMGWFFKKVRAMGLLQGGPVQGKMTHGTGEVWAIGRKKSSRRFIG
jgi:hypothetical protein